MTEQNTATMTYDSQSKKRTMNDPDMGIRDYLYDKSRNLSLVQDKCFTTEAQRAQRSKFLFGGEIPAK